VKVLTIVGARPQFIKAAPVSLVLRQEHKEVLVHTGQHYNDEMSAVFFREMKIPEPDYNLGIGSNTHGAQTGQMLAKIEEVLLGEMPDWVMVYGDTNSTLAGALAAVKLQIPLAHVEAGLRSFNRQMPEEHNRVLTDHCADMLFCPTQTAVGNLAREGITEDVHLVGDTMYDAVMQFTKIANQRSAILHDLELMPKRYLLATVHRPYNTDEPENLNNILSALAGIDEPIVFPVHPRTRQRINELGLGKLNSALNNLKIISPVGYLDMLVLEQNARIILTDSGGVQKEAYFFAVPCITLRPETEWLETVEAGWNILVGSDRDKITQGVKKHTWNQFEPPEIFGDGNAASHIVAQLIGE